MPKVFTYVEVGAPAGALSGSSPAGIFWGAVAGAVIGTGISLSIGLFYTSDSSMIAAVVFVSAIMGGIVGYVMSHLLNEEISFASQSDDKRHQILGNFRGLDLKDHQLLKNENQMRKISLQDAQDIVRSVRAG